MRLSLTRSSLICYIASFIFPVVLDRTDVVTHTVYGIQAFLLPLYYSSAYPFYLICWLANLFYFISIITRERKPGIGKMLLAILTVLLSMIFMFVFEGAIKDISVGYYLWVLSFILHLVDSIRRFRLRNDSSKKGDGRDEESQGLYSRFTIHD